MKHKKALIFIALSILNMAFSYATIHVSSGLDKGVTNRINQTTVLNFDSTPAPDFAITDVDSGITYYLHDFAGKKFVALDFFATWCSYCVAELPYLHELYMMYPHQLQFISIDVDNDETEAQVSAFRSKHDMDWIVGIDKDGTIASDYGVSGIPHLVLIDKDQNIVWESIGFDSSHPEEAWEELKNGFAKFLEPDTTAPTIVSLNISVDGELSIYNPVLTVNASATDDRNIKFATLIVQFGSETKTYELEVEKVNDNFVVSKEVVLTPKDLYGVSDVQVKISFTDYFGNTATSNTKTISVKTYTDTKPPEIKDLVATYSEYDDKRFNLTVTAYIDEDLLIIEASVKLLLNDEVKRNLYLKQINETHWSVSTLLFYSDAKPSDYLIKVEITDVAGNQVTAETQIEGAKGAPLSPVSVVAALLVLVPLTAPIMRRRKK